MTGARIAIVYDCFFPATTGGGERVYRAMAERFVERGCSVDYLTRAVATDDVPAGVRVVPLWSGEIYDANGTRAIGPALAYARAVARYLRAHQGTYDAVIASALPVLTLLAARWGLRRTRVPVVGDWLEVWSSRTWRKYSGALAGTAAWVLQLIAARATPHHTANSAFTADRLAALGAGRPIVLGLVDLVESAPRGTLPATPGALLVVGRHIPDKRLESIPAAVAELRRRGRTVTASIVGSGPSTPEIVDAVRTSSVEREVVITGRVSDLELESLYARAAALILPSQREGFGLVVAEAAAHGVPSVVVAAEDNAAAELIESGVNGEIAATAAAGDLADAIERVLDGGETLRASTARWFADARRDRSLSSSVDAIVDRLSLDAGPRRG